MKRVTFSGLFFLWLVLAPSAFASVRINEIAWMGTQNSANDEWIELSANGSTQTDLNGWRIEALDGSLSIVLSGKIMPGAFFLIERTDDTSVPNVTADLIAPFGKGLSNGGETLVLFDTAGKAVDTVVGGENWANTGGDNTLKHTAQRTEDSWVTGAPTPKTFNIAQLGEVEGASTSGSSATVSPIPAPVNSTNVSTSPKSVYPRASISVFAGDDKKGFVGFPVSFYGSSSGLYDEALDRATYRWNFGDGTIAAGKEVVYAYQFAGDYVVTLEVFWSTHRKSDRLAVVVVSPDVIINKIVSGPSGMIELLNRTAREIDLSGWRLQSEGSENSFIFSPNSILLAGKSFTVPNTVSHIEDGGLGLRLYLPEGSIADEWKGTNNAVGHVGTVSTPAPAIMFTSVSASNTKKPPSGNALSVQKPLPPTGGATTATGTAAAVLWERGAAEAAVGVGPLSYDLEGGMKWSFALAGVLLIVLAGFIISRSRIDEATVADEYAIIEDIIEGEHDLVDKRLL